MPLLSVVVPVFNRAELIRETLDSLSAGEYRDYEVIVVDDASTDGTPEMLSQYERNVRILRQMDNRGTGAARNLGVRHATGRYIAFLDSDDVWFPWTLATYARVIQEHDEPSFVTGAPFVFSSTEELEKAAPCETRVESFPDYYASADEWRWFSASSFVIRRDALLQSGGFTEANMNGEDADLALKLGEAHRFVQILAPFTFGYREHAGNLTADLAKTLAGVQHKIRTEMANGYPGGEKRATERRRILTRHVRPVALACLRAGLRDAGWQLYRETLPWHIKLGRWKFLLGFPLRALVS